jgi:CRISPR-associated protein Cmr5
MTENSRGKRTLEQKRAEHALNKIKEIETKDYGHYVSYVSSLPATIVMNGLGQALVTLLAKKDDPHKLLYDHVTDWLCEQIDSFESSNSLINDMMKQNQTVYLRAQAEAMSYLSWLKQFARAYLHDGKVQNA